MTPEFGYCFRPAQGHDDSSGPLHLWIGHYGVTRFIPTSYDIRRDEWDAVAGRLVIPDYSTRRSRKLAECARSMARNLRLIGRIVRELEGSRKRYTADDVANAFNQAVAGSGMLGVYAAILAEDLTFEGCRRAASAYLTAVRRFIAFNGGCDIEMSTITSEMMCDFQRALIAENVSRNTVSFYMRTLRAIYNKGMAEGIIPLCIGSPFTEVYTGILLTGKSRAGIQRD